MEAYRNRPGYASRWEDMLADIYLQSGQLKEWRMIIRSRAINGEWERYLILKQSFTAPEWILQQRGFLDELQANHQGRSIYAWVLINENLLDELLGWVRQQPDRIASYATYLHLHAPAEVEYLYEKYINRLSVQVSKRSEYRELAREIGKFAGYSTPARADEIRGHIMQQNPRRRALREELAKIRLE